MLGDKNRQVIEDVALVLGLISSALLIYRFSRVK